METPPATEITPPPPTQPSQRLKSKVAIVTGGSSGIGRAISLAYHREGAIVVVADVSPTSLDPNDTIPTHELINQEGGKSVFVKVDVTDAESVDGLVTGTADMYGRLDIMVNNAGVSHEATRPRPIWAAEDSTWHKTLAVNSTGVFYGCRAAARQMIQQDPLGPDGDRGWIINMASIFGQVAFQEHCAYVSSKHLVMGLTRTAALDCAPHLIHVNAICPGFTISPMTHPHFSTHPENAARISALHPLRGLGEPNDLARVAVFLASADARWVTGQGVAVDGGFLAQ